MGMNHNDEFSEAEIEYEEVKTGLLTPDSGKAPGDDGITKELLVKAGPCVVKALTLLFNWIIEVEYIPVNFRRGIQIPLYKGKNSSITDVNNYSGITLLSTFNLSLFKYLVFINSLLVDLEESRLCGNIYGIPVSPLGYADDIAAATTSKTMTDRVLDTVYQHSLNWRYKFNPPKSAVLVYGESDVVEFLDWGMNKSKKKTPMIT